MLSLKSTQHSWHVLHLCGMMILLIRHMLNYHIYYMQSSPSTLHIILFVYKGINKEGHTNMYKPKQTWLVTGGWNINFLRKNVFYWVMCGMNGLTVEVC